MFSHARLKKTSQISHRQEIGVFFKADIMYMLVTFLNLSAIYLPEVYSRSPRGVNQYWSTISKRINMARKRKYI